MTDTVGRYAQIPIDSNIVENIILMSAGFNLDGYSLIKIESDVCCQPGSYYNKDDGLFYDDAALTLIAGSSSSMENT